MLNPRGVIRREATETEGLAYILLQLRFNSIGILQLLVNSID